MSINGVERDAHFAALHSRPSRLTLAINKTSGLMPKGTHLCYTVRHEADQLES